MSLRIIRASSDFKNDLATYREERQPIIEDFLYEKQVLMISSDAGVGKSVLSEQAFLCLIRPQALFGYMAIRKPYRVYYLQLEGDYGEYIDRARMMRAVIPIEEGTFIWDECRLAEASNSAWVKGTLQEMDKIKPEVFIVDGLYKLTGLKLASEEGSKAIIRFLDQVQSAFDCAVWLNHHIHRIKYQEGKAVDEDDPFYGSQWLKAHVDTSFLMKRGAKDQVGLFLKKSRGSDVPKEILLHFNPETFTLFTETDLDQMSGEEKVIAFYKRLLKSGRNSTTFEEVQAETKGSHSHIRRIQMRHI